MLRLWKEAERNGQTAALLSALPERIPYRSADRVRALMKDAGVALRRIETIGNCIVAGIGPDRATTRSNRKRHLIA